MKNILFERTTAPYHGGALQQALIQLRGHQCEECGLTEWNGKPIPLEAHHIDGDKCNNTLDNLKLLCPNCHTLTPNYGSKNRNKREVSDKDLIQALQQHQSIRQALFSVGLSDAGANYTKARTLIQNNPDVLILSDKELNVKRCPDCGQIISNKAERCLDCYHKSTRKVERPDRETFKDEVYKTAFTTLGKQYGVSDKAIQKWCIAYNLPSKRSEIKAFSYDDWMKL